jgi:hypothetical protein
MTFLSIFLMKLWCFQVFIRYSISFYSEFKKTVANWITLWPLDQFYCIMRPSDSWTSLMRPASRFEFETPGLDEDFFENKYLFEITFHVRSYLNECLRACVFWRGTQGERLWSFASQNVFARDTVFSQF